MADNTYWGEVPTKFEIIEPGEHEDNRGTENEHYAVWMGGVLVQGTLEEWKGFADSIDRKIHVIEHPLKFGHGAALYENQEEITEAWKAAQEAAEGDSNDAELAAQRDLIDLLMKQAGVEVRS